MVGKKLPAKFINLDVKSSDDPKNKEKISTKKVVEMKDTVNRTSSPLLEVKGLTTRFLIKLS